MQITDIKITLLSDSKSKKAFVDLVLDEILAVHGIKIIDGKKGMFIAMPSKKKNEKYLDIVHPLNTEFRIEMQNKIINAYNKALKNENK